MGDFWRLYVQTHLQDEQKVADHLEACMAPLSIATGEIAEMANPTGAHAGVGHVELLFDHAVKAHECDLILSQLALTHSVTTNVEILGDRDWVTASLRELPAVAADRIIVRGAHVPMPAQGGQIHLLVEAGLAFGTGHHETTRGCLLALQRLERAGLKPGKILDVGTGTGILAMAAAKLFSCPIWASDIDAVSVGFARETLKRNGLAAIRLIHAPGTRHPDILRQQPFGLVVANILANPLIAMAGDLTHATQPGGRLILAGLLHWQFRRVLAAYQSHGMVLEHRHQEGDWSIMTLRRP